MFLKPDRRSCQLKPECDETVYLCYQSKTTELKCLQQIQYKFPNKTSSCEIVKFLTSTGENFDGFQNLMEVITLPHKTYEATPADFYFNANENKIYWEDMKSNELKRVIAPYNTDKSFDAVDVIIDSSFNKIGEIALLWDFSLIYYIQEMPNNINGTRYRLMVSNGNAEYSAVILDGLEKVISLTVSNFNSKLILVEMSDEDSLKKYYLQEIDLDGSNFNTIFVSNHMIESITVDDTNNGLYFTQNSTLFFYDFKLKLFMSVNVVFDEGENIQESNVNCMKILGKSVIYHKKCVRHFEKCKGTTCELSATSFSKKVKFVAKNLTLTNVCSSKHCQHLCIPSKSQKDGFKCLCSIGFKKVGMGCRLESDTLYYSDGHNIRGLIINSNHLTKDAMPPSQKFDDISQIDFDVKDNIYITDKENGEIFKMSKDGSQREKLFNLEKIFDNSFLWLGDMAVDWQTSNIYVTDQRHGFIEVSRNNGKFRKIITVDLHRPYLIAVDSLMGYIFFVDGYFKIFRQTLEGGKSMIEVNKELKKSHIFDFTLDVTQKLLFWCDHNSNVIGKMDYEGNSYEKISLSGETNPISLNPISIDAFKNAIYWIEEHTGVIKRISLSNRSDIATIKERNSIIPLNFKIYYKPDRKSRNPCAGVTMEKCHLCLFNGTHPNCHCAMGKLDVSGKFCIIPNDYLIYSDYRSVYRLRMDYETTEQMPEKLTNTISLKNITALAYDTETKTIYATDLYQGIYSIGKISKQIVENQTGGIEGIAVHPTEKLLFWTVKNEAEIRSLNLNILPSNLTLSEVTSYVRVIIKLKKDVDRLKAIAVEVCMNMIYYSNINVTKPSIQRAYISGYGRENIITRDIVFPSALALDHKEKKLYWTDSRLDKIEYCNYDGTKRVVLLHTTPKHPFGITVYENYVFWNDWFQNGIYRGKTITF